MKNFLRGVFLLLFCVQALAQSDADLVQANVRQLSAGLADTHPRLLLRPDDLPALRAYFKTAAQQPDGAALMRQVLPAAEARALIAAPRAVKNGSGEGARQWREGYKAAHEAGMWAQRHALAWLLSEDPAQGREAARWLLHLARWPIDRTVLRNNDELFIQHLRPMIFAYDWAWHALSADERATVSGVLQERLRLLAAHVQPKFSLTRPTPADNSLSHPMRFISTLGQGGLALFHEAAEAPGWLAWSYAYYERQFPVWGGDAGGWAEGLNYWSTGITQHQRFLEGMALLGFAAPLQRPFWRHTAYFALYGLMPYPASSFGDLTNILKPSGSIALLLEKSAVLNRDPYPLAFARALRQKPPSDFSYYNYDGIDAFLQRFRSAQAALPEVSLGDLPQSRFFDDIGVVSMHAKLGDAAHDIMLGFRSSPQGSASHAFSDQNSFVLNAFGQPLAINSGYREFYGSAHHVGWTRQTRAKNAVLFDGVGQRSKDASASGRITRFVDAERFTFASGDAQAAYGEVAQRALRHIFFVNRRYFVVFDELAAPQPIRYQWLLHARSAMQLVPERNEILLQQGEARLRVTFLEPSPGTLELRQTEAFDPPVEPAYRARMANEWHVTAETRAPAATHEFLTLLYPWHAPDSAVLPQAQRMVAAKGHAMRLFGQGGDDIVLMAREGEQCVDTGDWQLSGQAASFSQQGERLDFALIETTSLRGGRNAFDLQASRPVSLDGWRDAQGMHWRLRLQETLILQLRPGFAVREVRGAARWAHEGEGSVRLELLPGDVEIDVLRQG